MGDRDKRWNLDPIKVEEAFRRIDLDDYNRSFHMQNFPERSFHANNGRLLNSSDEARLLIEVILRACGGTLTFRKGPMRGLSRKIIVTRETEETVTIATEDYATGNWNPVVQLRSLITDEDLEEFVRLLSTHNVVEVEQGIYSAFNTHPAIAKAPAQVREEVLQVINEIVRKAMSNWADQVVAISRQHNEDVDKDLEWEASIVSSSVKKSEAVVPEEKPDKPKRKRPRTMKRGGPDA
jgi:hypothetical protein